MRLFIVLLLLALPVQAKVVQWSKGYTAGCDNPTEREDGTPLSVEEINRVVYQITQDGSTVYEILMMGGCKDTYVDTKSFVPAGEYLLHGYTVDTEGQESSLSSPGVTLTVQKAKPKAPSGFR